MRLVDHEAFKAMQAEVDEANRLEEQERKAQQLEAQRLRAEQGQMLNREFQAKVEEYEQLAALVHAKLGEMWRVVQEYKRLTSNLPPAFAESTFTEVNVPSLRPKANPHDWGSPFPTTKIAVINYFNTGGKGW